MDWLKLSGDVWRLIFQVLYDSQPLRYGKVDIFTLRAVCRYLRKVSSMRLNGEKWIFRQNPRIPVSYVRHFFDYPIRSWSRCGVPEDEDWTRYIKKRYPVFKKKVPIPQQMESISWCEPNERTNEKGCRSHHQKKTKARGDFRRSGAMDDEPWYGGYIPQFCSPSEVEKNRPWAKIECVVTERKDVYGVVRYKYISERIWKDPVTGVIHYRQRY